ncbi:MAG TPA: hypothetical protein VMS77_07050 [Conexivisphaerales archaeon]|nr:hypothetical protein [Conexivisphaerales archaeon]
MDRRAVQLVEEALLLVVAIITLSLLVGGIQGILTKAGTFTGSIWDDISKALDGLFGFLWHW